MDEVAQQQIRQKIAAIESERLRDRRRRITEHAQRAREWVSTIDVQLDLNAEHELRQLMTEIGAKLKEFQR